MMASVTKNPPEVVRHERERLAAGVGEAGRGERADQQPADGARGERAVLAADGAQRARYCVSRTVTDSVGNVMPCAKDAAGAVPVMMLELAEFWSPTL